MNAQAQLLDEFDRASTEEFTSRLGRMYNDKWLKYRNDWMHHENEDRSRQQFERTHGKTYLHGQHWCSDRAFPLVNRKSIPTNWNDSFLSFAMTYRLGFYVKEKISQADFNIHKAGRPWLAYAVTNEVEILEFEDIPYVNDACLQVISMLLQMGASPNESPWGTIEMSRPIISAPYQRHTTIWAAALSEKVSIPVLELLVEHGADVRIPAVVRSCETENFFGNIIDYVSMEIEKAPLQDRQALVRFWDKLIRLGADIGAPFLLTHAQDFSPLYSTEPPPPPPPPLPPPPPPPISGSSFSPSRLTNYSTASNSSGNQGQLPPYSSSR